MIAEIQTFADPFDIDWTMANVLINKDVASPDVVLVLNGPVDPVGTTFTATCLVNNTTRFAYIPGEYLTDLVVGDWQLYNGQVLLRNEIPTP